MIDGLKANVHIVWCSECQGYHLHVFNQVGNPVRDEFCGDGFTYHQDQQEEMIDNLYDILCDHKLLNVED